LFGTGGGDSLTGWASRIKRFASLNYMNGISKWSFFVNLLKPVLKPGGHVQYFGNVEYFCSRALRMEENIMNRDSSAFQSISEREKEVILSLLQGCTNQDNCLCAWDLREDG
jgi:hypothetical protein